MESKYLASISVTVAPTFTPKTKPSDGCSCFSSCSYLCWRSEHVLCRCLRARRRSPSHSEVTFPHNRPHASHQAPTRWKLHVCSRGTMSFHTQMSGFCPSLLHYGREKAKKVIITCNTKGEWYVDDKMVLSLLRKLFSALFQSSSRIKRGVGLYSSEQNMNPRRQKRCLLF